MRTRINIVQSVFHLHSTTKVAFSYYVKGSRYEYTNYDYIMDEAATEEPGSSFCSMVRLGTFRPFAEKAVANLIGWRIDEYDKLPPTIKDCLSSQNNLWREAPKNLDEIRRLQKVSFARSFSTSRSSSNSS
ncbi:hypothetical protein CBR_g12014 [Chara braunii]|nr:hypothetical protein CBR_g12014 [Chara braunii]|eukprot:GBG72438.1 hypothetical protein CBR_g12014 [Chara braunii]